MSKPLNIAIAGLGTVGGGTLKILHDNAALIAQRSGAPIKVVAVSSRDKAKAASLPLMGARWVDNAADLADAPDVDVVVELIGGSEGIARTLVERALANGKSVVTANKALIAHHGLHLAELAEKSGATLAFEAAVAGGIPIIKTLRDGLAANKFTRVAGIINGTCNYILSRMTLEGLDLQPVMEEAGRLGYLEADPSFDVDGIDAAHKLSILASLAFGAAPAIQNVYAEGIRPITKRDIAFAAELGYRIKLLGIATMTSSGVLQRVHPALVPMSSPLASVNGSFNAVVVEGDAADRIFLEGRGAGAGPTGSSVVADIMDIARGVKYLPLTLPVSALKDGVYADMQQCKSSYYVRLGVQDQPGVLADITRGLSAQGISMQAFLQHPHASGETVYIVLTTHETTEGAMQKALADIAALPSMKETPYLIRIENL